ncbi:MAG: 3-hydroxyacyl-[acyl-carrier-protein] dehydratase FabZ [Chlamydiia bacterium]|nr:3-hydroxyacyl-[acyl-carrier-protein] dehydratase FabZ [Chlamydiia bacterium]
MDFTQDISTGMDLEEIKSLIPHREPFLFVDRVLSCDLDRGTLTAVKTVGAEEPFFAGHFPGQPIMPGVLIIEALAQAGAIYISKKGMAGLKVLLSVSDFKFRSPVYPGDTILLSLEVVHVSAVGGKCKGVASVNGRKCAEGKMTYSIFKEKEKESL